MTTSWISRLFASDPSGNPLDDRYYDKSSGGYLSATGQRVSSDTALRVAAVYRCVSILANALAMLPLGIFEDLAEGGRRRAKEHPLDVTVSMKPNRRQTSFEFRRQVMVCLLLRQNAFAQIVDLGGGSLELVPLHPDRMQGPYETPGGELRWLFTRNDGTQQPLLEGVDVWHLQGLSEDGLKGLAMIDLGKDAVGLARAAEQHAARFYDRGVTFQGILEHPTRLKTETADAMSASFSRKFGGLRGSHSVPVLWEGMQFKNIGMNHKDAEFLDSRKFEIAEIARWFGVPPHMVGDVERSTSWGTGIESLGLQFLIYSLQPWLELWEESIRKDLVVFPERFYAKFNPGALLRMDAKTQAEVFAIQITNGIRNPNECRELLDLNPREGGDEYQTQMNMRLGTGTPPAPPPPGKTASTSARSAALARWCASQVLAREAAELSGLAAKAGGNAEKWGHAVASFYGRHATFVAEALSVTPDEAKAYCREQQETVTTSGCPASMEKWTEAHLARLATLAAGEVNP